ncbi:O-antigen/teichoic acid export membrane protein [Mycetocola sp. CAN_C7]|uniref:lipopolysaccharide biosynthesis protein n=1 Tax=Mycetocola sp. CAN_C7 TaxID=2787724 RepID=UPI0018CAFC59
MTSTGGYGASVLVSGVISIGVLPVIIILAGEAAWAEIAVAQGVAGFAYVLVIYGWGVTGPTTVASISPAERGKFYLDSLVSRFWLLFIVLPPAIVIALLFSREYPALVALTVVTGVGSALSGAWFFVGEASPGRYFAIDTIPKSIGTLSGAGLLFLTHDAVWFIIAQGLGSVIAISMTTADIARRYPGWDRDFGPRNAFARLSGQGAAVAMSATSAVYVNLPILIVGFFAGTQVTAAYALAERLMRFALMATRPVVQVAQSYVPSPHPQEQVRRSRLVTSIAFGIGAAGGLAYAAAMPAIVTLFSGSGLEISFDLSVPLGLALGAMLVSQITGFACLTAFGLTRALATSTIAGAVSGAILLIPLMLLFGIPGVAAGLAISEVVVLIVQLVKLRPLLWQRDTLTA